MRPTAALAATRLTGTLVFDFSFRHLSANPGVDAMLWSMGALTIRKSWLKSLEKRTSVINQMHAVDHSGHNQTLYPVKLSVIKGLLRQNRL